MLHVNNKFTSLLLLITAILAFSSNALAQITIAPTTIFITERNNIANYLVINNSNEAQEVSVEFFFGYVKTDENGNRQIINDDPELASEYSLAEWLRGFPRTFTLEPDQRQTVRIRANPPSGLEDRTYWARIRTSSNPVSPLVEEQQEDVLTARINVRIDQVTGIYLKKGNLSTGIKINDISLNPENDKLTALVDLDRTGNSPFIGSIITTITKDNLELLSQQSTTTIFVDGIHRFEFDTTELDSGTYNFNIRFETSRPDIRNNDLIQGETVNAAKEFILSD